jgi:hypothetical protein
MRGHPTVSWIVYVQHMTQFFLSIQLQFQLYFLTSTMFNFQLESCVSKMLQNMTLVRIERQSINNLTQIKSGFVKD